MRPTLHPASSQLYRKRNGIVDNGSDDLFHSDGDRLPLHIAGPIVIALSLSLWGGIGFIISSLL
jgi:hypothetical protein